MPLTRLRLGLVVFVIIVAAFAPWPAAVATPVATGPSEQIAFTSNRTGTARIWLMNADGSNQTQVTHAGPSTVDASTEDTHPAWSPDGKWIAFSRSVAIPLVSYESHNQVESSIYVIRPDGTDERLLASAPNTTNLRPQWSPDGRHILFVRGTSNPPYDIWIMNADGTDQAPITTDGKSTYPAWSPNGRQIAFISISTGTAQIFVMNADGSEARQLTTTEKANVVPNWAPGKQILFTSLRDGGGRQIYVMNPDGSGQTRVRATAGEDKMPAWSADGTRIAFGLGARPCDPLLLGVVCQVTNGYEIYTMNADGSDLTRLTHTTVPERQFGENYPAWRPLPARRVQ